MGILSTFNGTNFTILKNVVIVLVTFLYSVCFGQGNTWQAINAEGCGDARLEYNDYFHSFVFEYPQPIDSTFGFSSDAYSTQRIHYCNDDSTKILYLVVEIDQSEPDVCICTDAELHCIAVHRTAVDTVYVRMVDWSASIHEEKHERMVKKMGKSYQNWEKNAKNKGFQKKAFTFQKCDQFVKNSSL